MLLSAESNLIAKIYCSSGLVAVSSMPIRQVVLITDDGEAIEGAALAEVEVLGVATFFINRVRDDDSPVM
ncbi:hypothetical protein ABK706_10460 [Enterobacter sichuanensis]